VELSDWQNQLEQHFKELKYRRNRDAPGHPVFGLEHNLSKSECTFLFQSIRNHIKDQIPSRDHWLVWVVYSSEIGYLYDGREYWETFYKETPGWKFEHRPFLKECFVAFNKKYNGLKPTGIWAEHFTIICWPIRNAILPPDLQRQLVRAMYNASPLLKEDRLRLSQLFGELIAKSASGITSRFRQLIEDPKLVGQIATALITKDIDGSSLSESLIQPSTLERILQDLEIRQSNRDFLQAARKNVQKNINFRNITGVAKETESAESCSEDKVDAQQKLDLSPGLILRPLSGEEWGLWLKLPNLSHIAVNFPELKDELSNSRCRVAGHERLLAGGRLLIDNQQVRLKSWPVISASLLKFENPSALLNSLLNYCFLRPGPIWLFKIAADDTDAYLLQSTHVRAKQKYILLFIDERSTLSKSIRPIRVQCDGIKGFLFELPNAITPELNDDLNLLGIEQTESIEVWPAGLTPAEWDGEGNAEWLSTEKPCINIQADHDITSYLIELGANKLELQPQYPGAPLFIKFPRLDVGLHLLSISAYKESDDAPRQKTKMKVRIRNPRPWSPDENTCNGFQVIVSPSTPTLEEFWEERIEIEIEGPTSWEVKVSLSFYSGGEPSLEKRFDSLTLPLSRREWSDYLRKLKNSRLFKDFVNKYDSTDSCTLNLDANELGAFKLHLEREDNPLRWKSALKNNRYYLQLHDDSEAGAQISVGYYKFESPDKMDLLDSKDFLNSSNLVTGGLFMARVGDSVSTIIIPPGGRLNTLLTSEPKITLYERNARNVIRLLWTHNSWANAKLTGGMVAFSLKNKILPILEREIFRLICGGNWIKIEDNYNKSRGDEKLKIIEEGLDSLNELDNFQQFINNDIDSMRSLRPIEAVDRLAKAMVNQQGYQRQHLIQLSEMSLRLAMHLKGITKYKEDKLFQLISDLVQNAPVIARMARAMVLALSSLQEESDLIAWGSSYRGRK
jgi:hypothetical protein